MKNDETLFNLFIMAFWLDHFDIFIGERFTDGDMEPELFYDSMTLTPGFLAVKSCFPEEYCSSVQSGVNYLKSAVSRNGESEYNSSPRTRSLNKYTDN